jgi:Rieske Fe-S protein
MAHSFSRRTLLASASSLAGAHPLCCTTPEVPAGSYRIEAGEILLETGKVPSLGRKGGAAKVIDLDHGVNLIVVEPEKGRFAALERNCTHGGAQVVYNGVNRTVQCTSWGHSEFALDGRVLGGSAKKPLPAHEVRREGKLLRIKLEAQS